MALADIGFENGEGLRKRFDAKPRFVNTVLADDFIVATASSDAHNNVANPTCGKLVAAAITTGLS